MDEWFMYFQYLAAVSIVLALPYMIEGKRIMLLLKERFLAKKGYVKVEFIGLNRRRATKIVKPDENGMFKSKEAANFINRDDAMFDIKEATFNVKKAEVGETVELSIKKVVEGVMPVYTFVAGSAFPHNYFSDEEMQRVGTERQFGQALLAAEATGEIEFLKKVFANPKLLMVMIGILLVIVISVYFSYETYTTLQTILVSRGGLIV